MEVSEPGGDTIDVIYSEEPLGGGACIVPFLMELGADKDVDAMLYLQASVENNWITILGKFSPEYPFQVRTEAES